MAEFPEAIGSVSIPSGAVLTADGTVQPWETVPPIPPVPPSREIDFGWYQEQRVKLRANEQQVYLSNKALAKEWYKIIKRSLVDLPIKTGGRSIINPEYGANLRGIATALAMSHRTLSSYRCAVARIRNEAHFNELIEGTTWSQLVWNLSTSAARKGILPKKRFLIQIPTGTADFLLENDLDAKDVTAVVVGFLRQPKIQRELLRFFKATARGE